LLPLPSFSGFANEVGDRLGYVLPMRKLGKTGADVTMLGVGGYHIGWTTERDAQEVIETALEGGIRFFDTLNHTDRIQVRYDMENILHPNIAI
jgi:predicted aldo/keto reductase-like oxidoreductase